ncbi:hypothetical protein BD414DRAFT_477014 [Trametes punicea]|nr:hypothetical protein BD414DRAFT_477014 [Trametes punicea]
MSERCRMQHLAGGRRGFISANGGLAPPRLDCPNCTGMSGGNQRPLYRCSTEQWRDG